MSANRNDIIAFEEILNGISIKNGKVGRPKSHLKSVYADGIYDSKNTRNFLRKKDIISNIPINKRNRKKPKKGRPCTINDDYISVRGSIERVFGWLKARFRKLEIRYEYYAKYFDAFLDFSIFFHNWKLLR
jgi:IS5 family transposase